MKTIITFALFALINSSSYAGDTLYFRLSNPWNTVKDANGKYLRKAVMTKDSGWLTLDYNAANILVVRSYYTDTAFKTKLYCHYYYNETKGFREQMRCYQNGQLNGITASFNEKGDTLTREIFKSNTVVEEKTFPGYAAEEQTFALVEKESEFPGGRKAWYQFLSENFRYPAKAVKKRIQGTVVVQFIIDKEGKVTDVSVAESVDPLLDEEAMRLINSSPPWIPAEQSGKRVNSYKKQPIVFRLE